MDLLNSVLGAGPGSSLQELRGQRADIVRHSQGYYEALLHPADPGGLSLAERALVAWRVAEREGHAGLAAHYRGLLAGCGPVDEASARVRRILDHVALVTDTPGKATPAHLESLSGAGLGPRDIVALSQLVAFVSYQVRAAFGLALLKEDAA